MCSQCRYCRTYIKKHLLEEHKQSCKNTEKFCKGCETSFHRQDWERHSCAQQLRRKVSAVRKDNMEINLKLLRNQVEHRAKLAENVAEIANLKGEREKQSLEIASLNNTIKNLEGQVADLSATLQRKSDLLIAVYDSIAKDFASN